MKKFKSKLKKSMVKLYLKAPAKTQYTLAKIGIKNAIHKKKVALEKQFRD